jgi:DNA sulfur modification protein DndE
MSQLNRIYVSENTDNKLRSLKGKTGLTPNLIIRLGLVLSLEEDGIPDKKLYGDDQAREFNRYTLTGPWDLFFMALLKERLVEDELDPDEHLEDQLKAHIARGVKLVHQRLKSLEDIDKLIEHAEKKVELKDESLDEVIEEVTDE